MNLKEAKFLPNRPQGVDLLDGKSQDKVATAIMQHIKDVDASVEIATKKLPRIVGVEGVWGSGKSNTLILLKEKLKDDYYFFTYDAWGNQEDLQRRSLLELLTKELIQEKMLVGETKIRIISNALDAAPKERQCSWEERLFTLLSRKSATHNVTIPTIHSSTKYFVLMIAVTSIWVALINAIKISQMPCWFPLFAFVLAFFPLLAFCAKMKQENWEWKDMWQMYQTSGKTDTSTYTISELEPSVGEFREWLSDLANAMEYGKKLVIIFDNMDRLPSEKVRQLWSSIQTFFAENGYEKVWCVIPFDRKHLANAFSEAGSMEEKLKLTDYYIEKTFPVVYRIPDPIVLDYRKAFEKLFVEAFKEREDMDVINRCYRIKYPKPNMREIISFINKCVSLCHIWGDEIRLTSIALFVMNKDSILDYSMAASKGNTIKKTPEMVIIDNSYIEPFENIIEKDEILPVEISALVYGVDKEVAGQLPLKNFVRFAMSSDESIDLNEYANSQANFFMILEEEVNFLEPKYLNNAVNRVATIIRSEMDEHKQKSLNKVWRKLGDIYQKNDIAESDFRQEVRLLMDEISTKEVKETVGRTFIGRFAKTDNPHDGKIWYGVYKHFKNYIKEKELEIDLPSADLAAGNFIDYVSAAQHEYNNYPVSCNAEDIVKTSIDRMNEGESIVDFIKIVKNDKRFDFSDLLDEAKSLIENATAKDGNIKSVLDICKELTDEPLKMKLNLGFLNSLKMGDDVKPDLRLLKILVGSDLGSLSDEDLEIMSGFVYKYTDTSTLWERSLSSNNASIISLLKYLITHNLHAGSPSVTKNILSELTQITVKTGVDKRQMIRFLNDWGRITLTEEEWKIDLMTFFPNEDWLKALVEEKNDLTKSIMQKYYMDIANQPMSSFFTTSKAWNNSSNWKTLLKIIVDDIAFRKSNPKNMHEIVEHLIEGICNNNITEGNTDVKLQSSLLSWVSFGDISTKMHEVMIKYGNGSYTINKFKFMSLHHYFEKVENQEAVILNKVLMPIIKDDSVQKILVDQKAYYIPLIRNHIEQASALKEVFSKMYNDINLDNKPFKTFIAETGILAVMDNKDNSGE